METAENTTAAQISEAIEKKQARQRDISAQLSAADVERDSLRTEIGRAVADGQPTETLKKRLSQLSIDIESNKSGYQQLEADIKALKEEHKAAVTAAAETEHTTALTAWAALLDDVDAEISELFRNHLSGRLAELEALEERVKAAERTLRAYDGGGANYSEIERPQIHVKRTGGRARPLLRALRTYAEGKPYHAEWALHGPIDHDANAEHDANSPDWFKALRTDAVGGGEPCSSEGMTLNELARL
jgi:predicted transcriptional regulator